ncbi:hypothetical protein GGF46_004593 [Coemansia sp. RSA 552]|nr:hypothetical protein GGF46_004593 [Coemansia sp. RSA 552]
MSAWDQVIKYLNETPGDELCDTAGAYTLDPAPSDTGGAAEELLVGIGGGPTVLGALRQQQQQQQQQQREAAMVIDESSKQPSTSSGASPAADSSLEWAQGQLQAFLQDESGDPDTLRPVWQLASSQLARALGSLDWEQCSGAKWASLLRSIVTDPAVSLENQQQLLRCLAAWFQRASADAIPAVVQSQVADLVQQHAQVVVDGLLLPLLERPSSLAQPVGGMISKAIKKAPATAHEALWHGLATIARASQEGFNEFAVQVADALVGATPTDGVTAAMGRCWVTMLGDVAQHGRDSKKLGAMMLHFVNRFGAQLDDSELSQIAAVAAMLTTPLKRAIVTATARKRKTQDGRQ